MRNEIGEPLRVIKRDIPVWLNGSFCPLTMQAQEVIHIDDDTSEWVIGRPGEMPFIELKLKLDEVDTVLAIAAQAYNAGEAAARAKMRGALGL